MRKMNSVKHLNRPSSHRKLMMQNLCTSLFYHERVETTIARAKAVKRISEKLITRAKGNQEETVTEAQKIHNMRIAQKYISNKEVLNKLFNDIAPRYKARNGGYTRILRIGNRLSDNSEVGLIELLDRKDLVQLKEDRKTVRDKLRKKKSKPTEKTDKPKKEKKK